MMIQQLRILLFALVCTPTIYAQGDLLNELEGDLSTEKVAEIATFKAVKIVNLESTRLIGARQLDFIISHRFGTLADGVDNFLGLDQASVRIQFIYGITDGINVSVSRSGFNKTYDLAAKYNILKQKKEGFPFTIVGYNIANVNTELDADLFPQLEFADRLGYASQLLIARKFNKWLSLELAPTFFHDNTVIEDGQDNAQFAVGFGGRFKLNKRFALIADYGLHLNRVANSQFQNPLALGVEIETGGHVFQLHFSNSQAIYENGFFGQSRGDFTQGDIFFGFNLARSFKL